jgi:trehalose 6-phosphate phosphatase
LLHWKNAQKQLSQLFSCERVGLVTDMDGTISPIVPVPAEAKPTEKNRELLQALHQTLALVAVVSGRAVEDVRQRVNLPELIYVGNHGLECWQNEQVVPSPQAKTYRPHLEAAIQVLKSQMPDGMWIEDKQVTLSIHYRHTNDPESMAKIFSPILSQIAEQNTLKLFQGRMIFELRPPIDIDKGTVFKQLVEEFKLDAALYIGDDTTDADALKMAQHLRQAKTCYALAVGVESEETPSAVLNHSDFLVSSVADVEVFLAWLLNASKASCI